MVRLLVMIFVVISLFSCSTATIKVDNGNLVHEKLYKVPIITSETWVRSIPAGPFDGMYLRCPNDQSILIFYTLLCDKFDYSKMTTDDYVNRIYLDKYRLFCADKLNPLTDKKFKNTAEPPIVNKDKKNFSIVYETSFEGRICSSNMAGVPMKVMDVFMEDPNIHYVGIANTYFVVFRYASPVDQYEKGINDFKEMVSKFQWIE